MSWVVDKVKYNDCFECGANDFFINWSHRVQCRGCNATYLPETGHYTSTIRQMMEEREGRIMRQDEGFIQGIINSIYYKDNGN